MPDFECSVIVSTDKWAKNPIASGSNYGIPASSPYVWVRPIASNTAEAGAQAKSHLLITLGGEDAYQKGYSTFLAAGGSRTYTPVQIGLDGDAPNVIAVDYNVDPNHKVHESDESNNHCTFTATVTLE